MTSDMNILAAHSADTIREGWAEIKNMRGISGFIKSVPRVVVYVQSIATDMHGADKKKLAVAILFKLFPLPIWLRWLPQSLVEDFVGALIDMVVEVVKNRIK